MGENNNKKFYTVKLLSEMLELHPQSIREYIKKRKLRAYKLGKRYRVSKKSLEEFLEKRKTF